MFKFTEVDFLDVDIFFKMSVYFIYLLVKRAGPFLLGSWENRSRATYNHTSWRDWLATHEHKALGLKVHFPAPQTTSFYTPCLMELFLPWKKMVPDLGAVVKDQAHYKWQYASPQEARWRSQTFSVVHVVCFSILWSLWKDWTIPFSK